MTNSKSTMTQSQTIDDGIVVFVHGDIEVSQSPALRAELISLLNQHEPDRMIIDLSGVPYMDSSGVATMIEALQVQRRKGKKLFLCNLRTRVYSMFEIASLDRLFNIVDDVETARRV